MERQVYSELGDNDIINRIKFSDVSFITTNIDSFERENTVNMQLTKAQFCVFK